MIHTVSSKFNSSGRVEASLESKSTNHSRIKIVSFEILRNEIRHYLLERVTKERIHRG